MPTTFDSTATGYYPTTPDDPNYKMEGGKLDRNGNPIFTLDQFRAGDAPYVTVAMDASALPYGSTLKSPDFPGVPFKVADTGEAFQGKGLSRIDIARSTEAGANHPENNGRFTFELAGTPQNTGVDLTSSAPVSLSSASALSAIPNLDLSSALAPTSIPDIIASLPQSKMSADLETPEPGVVSTDTLAPEDVPQPGQPPDEQPQAADIPHPSAEGARITGRNPDGSVTLSTGARLYRDGHLEFETSAGTAIKMGPNSKAIIRPPKRPIIKADGSGKLFAIDPVTMKSEDITPEGFQEKADQEMIKKLAEVDVGDAKGAEVLSKVPEDIRPTLQAIAEYRYPKLNSFALRSPYFQKMLNLVAAYDPSFDVKNYDQRQKLMNDFAAGKAKDNILSLNTVIGHLGSAATAFDDLGNINTKGVGPGLNAIKNSLLEHAGFASPGKYGLAADTAAVEIARALTGGVPNQKEINDWKAKFGNAKTPDAFKGVVQEAINLLSSRMTPYYDQYRNVMGKELPYSLLNQEPRDVVNKYGDENTIKKLNSHLPPAPFLNSTEATGATATAPATTATPSSTETKYPTISDQTSYDSLPSGSMYLGPDGGLRRKP